MNAVMRHFMSADANKENMLRKTSLAGGRWPRLLHDVKRGLVRSLPGPEYSEYKVCIMAFSSICFMDVRTFFGHQKVRNVKF